jgi:hypothetical protein
MPANPLSDDEIKRRVDAIVREGNISAAAVACGISRGAMQNTVREVQRRSRAGDLPAFDLTHPVPPGLTVVGTSIRYNGAGEIEQYWNKTKTEGRDPDEAVKLPDPKTITKVSTLYDQAGRVSQQWIAEKPDLAAREAAWKVAAEAFKSEIQRVEAVAGPQATVDDLANCYILTDYHLGMLAWPEETGEPWDMKIAEALLMAWFSAAILQAPAARVGVFAQLGDLLHWDGMEAVTPTSRHILDADTRFQKLVHVAIRCVRRIIGMLLEKHEHVHVLMADANHDPASGVWLREMLAVMYENEPRVSVDTRPDPYYCYEHGAVSLFFHHGHRRKPSAIDDVFVAKFRDVFGRTKFSYAHMGHLHHFDSTETNLMIVEQHRTLAAKDAYASKSGYMSGRSACAITYHKKYGEVGRVTITPEMVTP